MKKTLLLILLAAPALTGCIEMAAVGVGAAALSVDDRRTTGTQIEDEGIELRAKNRIAERWGDKASVGVTSYNRSVLLTGTAADAKIGPEIERMVKELQNVRGVTNEIAVGGAASAPAAANDGYLTGKVKARMLDSKGVNPNHVKVVTEASVVYLMGIVTEKEAAAAVEIARTTGGVRKVVKVFDYCRPSDPACAPRAAPKGGEAKPAP